MGPLVSIAVIAYNSAPFIVEALESVRCQTYQNIELIISDDCSTDNTLRICEKWCKDYESRFVRCIILAADHNTGQSGNYNRAFDACRGEWIKELDGDDVLCDNCIEEYVKYTIENPSTRFVFSRMGILNGTNRGNQFMEDVFDYTFFSQSNDKQLERLVFEGNCIPGPTAFYQRQLLLDLCVRCDERIPMIEDYSRWIRLVQNSVHFDFLDKCVVLYRLGSGVSTQKRCSLRYFDSFIMTQCLYCYPIWREKDEFYAAQRLTKHFVEIYDELLRLEKEISRIRRNRSYRLMQAIMRPLRNLKHLFGK